MKKLLTSIVIAHSLLSVSAQTIYQSNAYSIYPDKVVQGKNEAKALSATQMMSNYQSPANEFQSANIIFKFSINGRDNEMYMGKNHEFTVDAVNGKAQTPVIKFGSQISQPPSEGKYLSPNTAFTLRVDMTDVLKQFNEQGFYITINGDKIYKEDFKGLFVAGPTAPMTWDFDNLVNFPELRLKDDDGDGIYETTLVLNKQSDEKKTDAAWRLSKDISPYPQYSSPYMISDAIYNMSLEEMLKAIEPDSTFRTGKEWSGVWTRDISYSIILSMAHLQPQVAKHSLMKKVNAKKRIIQDTGTGGAWPISTDRMIWAVAAWKIYKATGDKDWLRQSFVIIKNSVEDDLYNAHDPETGLVKGESSFLDWREQTYPKWMQPADIFESQCLGTNAAHFQASSILSQMAVLLKDAKSAAKYKQVTERIKKGINTYLWVPEKGYYAQFRYGRNYKFVSPRAEALGEALCILFGIADEARAKQIVERTPVTSFGISCIYPQIPDIPPYHNNAVWPFVQSYWLWAGAKAGNGTSVMESISAIYRPAALFLTNKENFVAENGDFNGTQINSSIMLWSLAGNISIVHKVLFGAKFNANNLSFEPFVPKEMAGNRTLQNFKYREAILNVTMEGFGSKIKTFLLDGKQQQPVIPSSLTGTHTVHIVLANYLNESKINKVNVVFSPAAPAVKSNGKTLSWDAVKGATKYSIVRNGKVVSTVSQNSYDVPASAFSEYSIVAVAADGTASFASEPVVVSKNIAQTIEMESVLPAAAFVYKGFMGKGFTETSKTVNTTVRIPVNIKEAGRYSIVFRYANGNGPTNTENKCAIRTLKVDGAKKGTIVLPQRGKEEWSNWGNSNAVKVQLQPGAHVLLLTLDPANENMNGEINQAMLDNVTITKL